LLGCYFFLGYERESLSAGLESAVTEQGMPRQVKKPSVSCCKLNDTGIVFGGNYPNGNNATCTGETIASQDCSTGRDTTHNDKSDGYAGLSFTKISKVGAGLPPDANDFACIQDNVTGLVWENKTTSDVGSIHNASKTYKWGGKTAQIVDGQTFGNRSNEWDVLVDGSNSERLCGFNDWRVPSRLELGSIVDYNNYKLAIDSRYFPIGQSALYSSYWSSTPADYSPLYAWGVAFDYGYDSQYDRNMSLPVRLVRSGQ
jgi:hypothetical protein